MLLVVVDAIVTVIEIRLEWGRRIDDDNDHNDDEKINSGDRSRKTDKCGVRES
jgi:hypothetical protein